MTTQPPQPEIIERLGVAAVSSIAMVEGMKLDLFTPLADGPSNAEQIADVIGVGSAKLKPLPYALVMTGLSNVGGDFFLIPRRPTTSWREVSH